MCTGQRPSTSKYRSSLFLHLFLTLLFWMSASAIAADSYIVSHESEVAVRSGQGTEYKIVALLKNGDMVTALEESTYWIRVRTATGREGWTLKRFLTSHPAPDDNLNLPSQENQINEQLKINGPLSETPGTPSPSSTPSLLTEKTQTPPAESQPPQMIRERNEQAREIEELRSRLETLTKENQKLQQDERIEWFLAGGAVFLIGWILGLISGKARRRKPSLL